MLILSLFNLLFCINSQWKLSKSYLNYDQILTNENNVFIPPIANNNENFITCQTPNTSYITLNEYHNSAQCRESELLMNGCFVILDLFFQGTWNNDNIIIDIGTQSQSYSYSISNYILDNGFCDDKLFVVKAINITSDNQISGKIKFTLNNNNQGEVSIRNLYILQRECHPSCKQCVGPKFNQCLSCYIGTPIDQVCPQCSQNQYLMKSIGCRDICGIESPLYKNGVCQNYPIQDINTFQFLNDDDFEKFKWSLIFDPQHLDTTPNIIQNIYMIYGIFKFNSGIQRFFNLTNKDQSSYSIGLMIEIAIFNNIPIDCGIQIKLNNTYYGSIYNDGNEIQTHNLKIYQTYILNSIPNYVSNKRLQLITYLDIPLNSFLFSSIGNYTNNSSGWGIISIRFTKGFCPSNCKSCQVSFNCSTCMNGYYLSRDGTCQMCTMPYQVLIGQYCKDYDDETPYSQYLIKDFVQNAFDPEQYSQYILIDQSGLNFLKGSDIFYSYLNYQIVFGGPFVWAQAKFQRIHNIVDPHHRITVSFYIIYGPSFSADGNFIYQIENDPPVSKSNQNLQLFSNGAKIGKIYHRILHNTNSLKISWECSGSNNEPVNGYCGFFNYYIAVHYCQPYCLQCSDQNTCTQWNSTYDSSITKNSQADCQSNEYFDRDTYNCLQCPSSCLTCTSKIDCQTCQPTYIQSKLGCFCKINQYENLNQCHDCPNICSQCLSSTYCIECLLENNRQLQNGQCNCIDGYYSISSSPQCKLCHSFCSTCTGPTTNDCLTCSNILKIEQDGQICRCQSGTSYEPSLKQCLPCHSSCLTCFKNSIDGCITCEPTLNRILKGLKCECAPGYYELNNICINCPNTENQSLTQCYNQCQYNQLLWHTSTCGQCDTGFQLIQGDCQPICGDQQIKGNEQCEDNNTNLDDKCYNCQYQCPIHCLTCDATTTLPCPDICGDGIITGSEECDDQNTIQYDGCYQCRFQCQAQCTKCIKGECFDCATEGWTIDPTVVPWQCKEVCGDMLIVGNEQCEDANFNDDDGCKDCKYFCSNGCSQCDFNHNICLSCQYIGFFPVQFFCQSICGDGLVAIDPSQLQSEQCDDGNTIDYDGCSSTCKFQCQPNDICIDCLNNRCLECAIGYNLTIDYICIPICGNSIVDANEQCDDGNLIYGDGCHFCQFSCQDSCLSCIQGICYHCQDDYQLIEFEFNPYCVYSQYFYTGNCESNQEFLALYPNFICLQNCDINCNISYNRNCQQYNNGYELNSNEQYCINPLQYQVYPIENCYIQIGNNCINCKDQQYFDVIEQIYNFNLSIMTICEYSLKLTLNLYYNKCPEYCTQCSENNCVTCENGYYLNINFQCISFCGDGIIAHDEQCEINDINCLNCTYETPKFCEFYFGNICHQCQDGYYLKQFLNICESQFGYGIVTNDEVFEDYNFLDYDGLYQCSKECIDCINGVCQQCKNNFLPFNGFCINAQQDLSCSNEFEMQRFDVNCKTYIDYVCQECREGWKLNLFTCESICGDYLTVGQEECDDGNQVSFDGCFQCRFQCPKNCLDCQFGICSRCLENFELDQISTQCRPIQTLIQIQEQPYFAILSNKQSKLNNQYINLDMNENTCIINQDTNKCFIRCKQCFFSQCLECEYGYYGNQCLPKCGDGIVVQEEECDDGTSFQIDFCLNCKYECPQYCNQCAYGICTNCIQGFYLDTISNSCQSICGDKLLARDEVCDDGNEIGFDGCFECKFQCQKECLDCQFGKCKLCESSLILVQSREICEQLQNCENQRGLYYDAFTNNCLSKCGDGIIAGNEQCDDQNQLQYDGCYNCQYQCDQMCINCIKGNCLECQYGYHLKEQKCNTQCGDGIKIGDEQCDDKNEIIRDGCTSCKIDTQYQCQEDIDYLSICFKCQESCEDCKYNNNRVDCLNCKSGYFLKDNTCIKCSEKCKECVNTPNNCTACFLDGCKQCDNFSGFYQDEQKKSCITKCGDNIVAGIEQCDDGNLIEKDGCNSKCEIEKDYTCKGNVCQIYQKKKIDFKYSNSTTANDFDLEFEDLEIDEICDKLNIQIEQFLSDEFLYQVSKKLNQTQDLVGCEIKFNFFKTIQEYNLIHLFVPLNENVSRILQEETREIIIIPRKLIYYNQDQKAQAKSIVEASKTFTFILQLIGPLTIVCGGFNFFWTILDILAWINNFYFLNVDYPLNIKLFFNQFQFDNLFKIPDIINLNQPNDPYYFESPPKFAEKDVNPLFLNNIQLSCVLILLALIAYCFSVCMISIIKATFKPKIIKVHQIEIFSVIQNKKPLQVQDPSIKIQNQSKFEMPTLIKLFYKEILYFKLNFKAKLFQILGLVFLDICLACALQLQQTSQSQYFIINLNILLAFLGVISIIFVFKLYLFVCSQHSILYETKIFQNSYSSLYEGINTKNLLGRNYCFVNLLRKTMFIFFTVYFYDVPLIQTSLCCLTCFLNLALIIYENPFENRQILLQSAIPDFCIFIIISITVLLAVHDTNNILTFDEKYFFGWIILSFIGISIFVQILFLLQQFYFDIIKRLIQIKDLICNRNQNQK